MLQLVCNRRLHKCLAYFHPHALGCAAALTLRGHDKDEAGAGFLRFAKQMTYLAPLCAHRFLRNPGRPLSGNDAWTKLRRAMWIGIILGLLAGAASGSIPAALTLAVAGGAIGWMVSKQSASAAAGDSAGPAESQSALQVLQEQMREATRRIDLLEMQLREAGIIPEAAAAAASSTGHRDAGTSRGRRARCPGSSGRR